ncbi:uncharacterized protein TNCV_1302611 [Trichonephila clavipes]|nr:uncharacterized protein TNCV_1302611 [Trichonephila clavipes]
MASSEEKYYYHERERERIPIIPTDVPIEFKGIQFPIRLAFVMTINKSQGQTMSVCVLDLDTPHFSHGQLYVACSRVASYTICDFRRFINSKASRRSCIIMPPKRRAIGRSTPQARKRRALRASESDEQRALKLKNLRVHATETRSSESSDQREVRLETDRIRTNQIRSSETTELRERRLQNIRISTARSRRTLHADLNLSAFHYDSNNDYSLHLNVVIGKMDKICMYCSALKFKNETRGMLRQWKS